MGIERFFGTLSNDKITKSNVVTYSKRIDANHILIDFNSIVYSIYAKVIGKLNKEIWDTGKPHNLSQDDLSQMMIDQSVNFVINMLTNMV